MRFTYITRMSMPTTDSQGTPRLGQIGGFAALLKNPGLILFTLRHGRAIGTDATGNRYFEERRGRAGRRVRRWVVYAGVVDASKVPPEWHAWLHYLTDAPLPASERKPWQKPHQANLTGTAAGYRPAGHDYQGGSVQGGYEAWSPGA
jgi:NADH:ubiquinone oxidoreductase subunit